jgi:hypothetical protein
MKRGGPMIVAALAVSKFASRKFYRVVITLLEPLQHPFEMIDCKDESPGVGIIEQHRRDFAHAHDLANAVRLA